MKENYTLLLTLPDGSEIQEQHRGTVDEIEEYIFTTELYTGGKVQIIKYFKED